jgi:hypothetical protein
MGDDVHSTIYMAKKAFTKAEGKGCDIEARRPLSSLGMLRVCSFQRFLARRYCVISGS